MLPTKSLAPVTITLNASPFLTTDATSAFVNVTVFSSGVAVNSLPLITTVTASLLNFSLNTTLTFPSGVDTVDTVGATSSLKKITSNAFGMSFPSTDLTSLTCAT